MGEVTILVEYEVKPERRAEFETAIRAHAAGTLADEKGCVRFDVLTPREEINRERVFLVEVYRDEAAYQAHLRSPRLPRIRDHYKDMIRDRRIVPCDAA